jgi:hypothetical protein
MEDNVQYMQNNDIKRAIKVKKTSSSKSMICHAKERLGLYKEKI